MAETWTVLRLLQWTTEFLRSRGAESPRLEAEVLLAHARNCERIALYTAFDEVVSDETRGAFRELVKRRGEGTPVAYLVGSREFYSLNFRVTPDVLIPRPETEFVVVEAVEMLKASVVRRQEPGARGREPGEAAGKIRAESSVLSTQYSVPADTALVADVGTGSGAIAVAIAKHAPFARIVAIDISSAALAVAKENAASHQVAERIEFLQSDLLEQIPTGPQLAVIASNPPYIGERELDSLPASVREHEPRQALIAGPTGTEVIERLIPQAAERLLPGGWLMMEVSPLIAGRVVELIAQDGRYEPAAITKDLAGLARVVKARRKS